ncbi:MAG: DUF6471 domain-containing protein [Gammaproteobacteria bacterium]
MAKKSGWEIAATNILKSELTKKGINYEGMSVALSKIGVEMRPENINKNINLGKFTFKFFLQCAKAIGIKNLRLDELLVEDNE